MAQAGVLLDLSTTMRYRLTAFFVRARKSKSDLQTEAHIGDMVALLRDCTALRVHVPSMLDIKGKVLVGIDFSFGTCRVTTFVT